MYGQFNPYQQIMPTMGAQSLIRVNGIDGAKATVPEPTDIKKWQHKNLLMLCIYTIWQWKI